MKKIKINGRKSGSMLAFALVIVLVLAIVGVGLLRLGLNARLQAIKDVLQISARSAADAGIEHAVRYMIDAWNSSTSKGTWLAAWEDITDWIDPAVPATAPGPGFDSPTVIALGSDIYGNAQFEYTIYKSTRLKGYQIVSSGTARSTTRTVHAAAVLKSAYIGVGAKEEIYLAPNVALATIPAGETMVVQTNGTAEDVINVKPGVTVPGDVVCGPGGDPDEAIKNQGTITGQEMAAEEEIEFPPVYVPEKFAGMPYATIGAGITIDALDPTIAYIITDVKLDGFKFDSGVFAGVTTVIIQGDIDIFVDGDTYFIPDSNFVVADDSTLDLYLGGNLWAQPNSSIIYGGEVSTDDGIIEAASSISIKGTSTADGIALCDEIHFQPDGDFYGTIYAPDASIELWPNGDFYGAVIGGYSVEIKPGGSFYYIPELVDTDDVEILYMGVKYGSWWEEAN